LRILVDMKALFFCFYLLLLGMGLPSCTETNAQAPPFQPNVEQQAILNRIENYLVKDSILYDQLSWDENGISIYPDSLAKVEDKPEVSLPWKAARPFVDHVAQMSASEALDFYLAGQFENLVQVGGLPDDILSLSDDLPLQGVRIALDPGHVGGTMELAYLEKKFIRIRKGNRPEIHKAIAFNEGNLALGTALLLRDSLEKLGAQVLLTRSKEGHTAFDMSYEAWLESETQQAEARLGLSWADLDGKTADGYPLRWRNGAAANYIFQQELVGTDSLWWMTEATMRDIYRIPFLKADFKQRASEINAFHPDLTLILHYNIWEKNTWSAGQYLNAVDDNYCMAFIPGSFMAGELGKPETRMAFLQKALSDDIPESERLSAEVVKGFEKHLGIPAIPYDTSLRYLRAASLPTPAKGVFARNLSLTRMVNGPICFGEALYQDNLEECLRLQQKQLRLKGMRTQLPNRLKDVVNAYVEGVLQFIQK